MNVFGISELGDAILQYLDSDSLVQLGLVEHCMLSSPRAPMSSTRRIKAG
jgi:hypothetical protein